MEAEQQPSKRGVWWRGALSSAMKGIPQGLLLGGIGFGLLVGGIYALSALGATSVAANIGSTLSGFLFTSSFTALPSFSAILGMLNPLPFIALNTALTVVGNFLIGGDVAVAKHQQEVDHAKNKARIDGIEAREMLLERVVDSVAPNAKWLDILEKGPRNKTSYAAAVEEEAAQAPAKAPVLH